MQLIGRDFRKTDLYLSQCTRLFTQEVNPARRTNQAVRQGVGAEPSLADDEKFSSVVIAEDRFIRSLGGALRTPFSSVRLFYAPAARVSAAPSGLPDKTAVETVPL